MADPAAPERLGNGRDGLVLADDALVQDIFHFQKPLALVLRNAGDGDARPAGHDGRDVLGADAPALDRADVLPVLARFFNLLVELPLAVPDAGRALEILALDGRFLSAAERFLFASSSLRSGGSFRFPYGRGLDASSTRSMALSGRYRSLMYLLYILNGWRWLVVIFSLWVGLILVAQALRIITDSSSSVLTVTAGSAARARRPFQRACVLVSVVARDDLDLAPAERRLDDVGRVDGAFGGGPSR